MTDQEVCKWWACMETQCCPTNYIESRLHMYLLFYNLLVSIRLPKRQLDRKDRDKD